MKEVKIVATGELSLYQEDQVLSYLGRMGLRTEQIDTEKLTTEGLNDILLRIQPLIAHDVMSASFRAPVDKVFKLRNKMGAPIYYSALGHRREWREEQTDEFMASNIYVSNGRTKTSDLREPVIEARAWTEKQEVCHEDTARSDRISLNDAEVSVEDLAT